METALGYKELIEKDLADMPPELLQNVPRGILNQVDSKLKSLFGIK